MVGRIASLRGLIVRNKNPVDFADNNNNNITNLVQVGDGGVLGAEGVAQLGDLVLRVLGISSQTFDDLQGVFVRLPEAQMLAMELLVLALPSHSGLKPYEIDTFIS